LYGSLSGVILSKCSSQLFLYVLILLVTFSISRFCQISSFLVCPDNVCPAKGRNNFISAASLLFTSAHVSVQASEPFKSAGSANVL
jgi:hypothetical protein